MTHTLMVQGTTSDAGKSILVAGLCRVLANRQVAVAPFKPQNMALNSAVTSDGGEIGRAQALQAQACGIECHSDMNPILLKPSSDTGAQVIVHGKVLQDMEAVHFHQYKAQAMSAVLQSYGRLSETYQAIIVEGAGSPAEINLREGDIANMGFAEAVDCPVIIVADIDKGGVFAHLVGTLDLLSQTEKDRVVGFVINKFRGDIALLKPGLDWLEQRTKKPVIGVLPYLPQLYLDAEDAVNVQQQLDENASTLKVVVPVLGRISNHTDFDVLRLHPQVDLCFVGPGQPIPPADLIILPGSKNVRQDLLWLTDNHWPSAIKRHLRYGGKLMGICGGYQMLGQVIHDPLGIEDNRGSSPALALLQFETVLQKDKNLTKVSGTLNLPGRPNVAGYEIHCGKSEGEALANPAINVSADTDYNDGVISDDNLIFGSYLHGLFDHPRAGASLLQWAGLTEVNSIDVALIREQQLQRLAKTIEQHLDLSLLFKPLAP